VLLLEGNHAILALGKYSKPVYLLCSNLLPTVIFNLLFNNLILSWIKKLYNISELLGLLKDIMSVPSKSYYIFLIPTPEINSFLLLILDIYSKSKLYLEIS